MPKDFSWRIVGISSTSALLLFILSWWSWHVPLVGTIATLAFFLATIFAFSRSLTLGTSMILWELVIGSFGHELSFHLGEHTLPIRLGMFVIAAIVMLIALVKKKQWSSLLRLPVTVRWPFAVFILCIIYGILLGIMHHGWSATLADANAYAYFLLAPLFLLSLHTDDDRKYLWSIVAGGVIATSLLTIFLALYFTDGHTANISSDVYRWIRDFGFGELTPYNTGFVRVFLQSQFWGALLFVMLLISQTQKKISAADGLLVLCFLLLILSQSRTIWSAITAACVAALICLVLQKKWNDVFGIVVKSLVGFFSIRFFTDLFLHAGTINRVATFTSGAAVDSRFALLTAMKDAILKHPFFGSGFGTALTYITHDPRLLSYFPNGNYTTTAFEWGWLDAWLKMGLFGMIALAACVVSLLVCAKKEQRHVAVALIMFFLVVHTFSPWLNHPIGITALLLVMATLAQQTSLGKNLASRAATP